MQRPILRGTGIRAQTIVLATREFAPAALAEQYDISEALVQEALNFYAAHRAEIDAYIEAEAAMVPAA